MNIPPGWRPFRSDSPWNTRIPERPAIDPRAGQMIRDLFLADADPTQPAGKPGVAVEERSVPVHIVADTRVEWAAIHYSLFHKFCHPQPLFTPAPVTPRCRPDRQGDARLCIVNKALAKAWDSWSLKRSKGHLATLGARSGFDRHGRAPARRRRMPGFRLSADCRTDPAGRDRAGTDRARVGVRLFPAAAWRLRLSRRHLRRHVGQAGRGTGRCAAAVGPRLGPGTAAAEARRQDHRPGFAGIRHVSGRRLRLFFPSTRRSFQGAGTCGAACWSHSLCTTSRPRASASSSCRGAGAKASRLPGRPPRTCNAPPDSSAAPINPREKQQ